ncbi:hypothetical protein [Saccharopolyspora sp. NPDC002686]|uniref:hypothetical protein n=1 Tax=Saccharopolyspora sp. NPDC002686 TaxID=3154541 RepID=UPI00332A8CE8
MAERIQIPEDLKQRFSRLLLAEDDIREALFIWNGLDQAVKTAAGNDEETSKQIKEKADQVNPSLTELLTSLGDAFGINSEKGQETHKKFADADAQNTEIANKFGTGTDGGSFSGGGRH